MHLKQKLPSTLQWWGNPESFKLTEIEKGIKGRKEEQSEGEEGEGRKEEGQMTYHHKTVQNLIKTGNRTEVWRGRWAIDALGECACTQLAHVGP